MNQRFYFEQNLWDLFQKRQGTLLILCQPRLGEVQKPPKFGWHLLHAVCTTSVFYSIFQGSPIQPETKTMHCVCTHTMMLQLWALCQKKTLKECISIPMAQVEGLLPLTPHPVPPSCWKVDKKGWDVFVIRIVSCLCHIRIVGCLRLCGLWVVYRRGGGCPPPLLLASVLGRGDRPNLNPTHLPPSTLNPQNHKSKSNEIGSDHPRYNKMIRS